MCSQNWNIWLKERLSIIQWSLAEKVVNYNISLIAHIWIRKTNHNASNISSLGHNLHIHISVGVRVSFTDYDDDNDKRDEFI